MVKQKIEIGFEVKTIYHLADIHIRNLKRHTEYLQVFERLQKEISKDLDNAIIYVGGDIVHAKTEMSPELIDMTVHFLRMLADMAPTFLITGNHDCNLNNKNRLDALLPIIEALKHPNLHYLRLSGVYNISNLDFAVFSRLDDITEWPSAKDCKSKIKIAAYHGTVDNAISDTGFKLSNDKVKLSRFDGFDLGLFGDIHKHQYLNNKKTIAYPSSLIQQNHGEDYVNHGILKWDVDTKKSTFIKIENDYGFYTLRIQNGNVLNDSDIPKKPRIRIQLEDTPISEVQRIIAEVRKKYNVQDVVISNMDTAKIKHAVNGESTSIIGNIQDPSYQNELITDYLYRHYNQISDELLNEVKEINNKTNSEIEILDNNKGFTWKIKKLEFSNMFSYGENNSIDFSDMQGVYGLFAPNTSGKSSLVDVILFCLFDKCSRAFKAIEVLNADKKWFNCKIQFELQGQDYFIEKTGKIDYAGGKAYCPVSVNFWREDNGIPESLNGEQRRDTNNNIQQYIGTYENFVLTAVSLQNDNTGFINMSQTERKNLLASFLGLNIYEKLWWIAKDDIKEVDIILKEFKKQDLATDLAELENEIERKNNVYSRKKEALEDKQSYIEKINEAIIVFTKELKDVNNNNLDINELNSEKLKYENEIIIIKNKITTAEKNIQTIKDTSLNLLEEYSIYDIDSLKDRKAILNTKEEERNILKINVEKIKTDISNKKDKLEKLKNLEYDTNCKYCMNNVFVKDAIETREQFEDELEKFKEINNQLNDINDLIQNMSTVNSEIERFNELNNEIQKLKSKYITTGSEVETLSSNLKLQKRYLLETENNIKIYYKNQSTIEKNRDFQEKIHTLEDEKKIINNEIKQLGLDNQKLHSEIKVLENRRSNILESIKKASILEKRQKAYEMYLECISRNGIPYELISKVVPIFETKANNILMQISEFNVMLNLDNKNVDAYIVYGDGKVWSLNLTSGMEKFISSIALRVALNSISNIPKPNCLFIDEGFGNLDADNIANMALLFNYLKTQYDFLMVVSHLDIMRDMTDNMIELKRIDGYSKLDFKE